MNNQKTESAATSFAIICPYNNSTIRIFYYHWLLKGTLFLLNRHESLKNQIWNSNGTRQRVF